MVPDAFKNAVRRMLDPITDALIAMKITPNVMTLFGMILTFISGLFYGIGYFRLGAVILIFAGISDTFDGQIARKTNSVSHFGAFFDSTTDRFNEFFVLAGIGFYYLGQDMHFLAYMAVLAAFFSIMVSYVRARAEGLGYKLTRGLMTRVERVVFIIAASFFPLKIFNYMLILFTLLTFITVIERIIRTKRIM